MSTPCYLLRSLVIVAILFVLAFSAFLRNEIWLTKLSLWNDIAQKSPMKARVRNNLGNCYLLQARYDEAILEYNKAIELDSSYLQTYLNFLIAGTLLERDGLQYQAAYVYDVFCNKAPELFHNQKNLACEKGYKLAGEMNKNTGK